LSFDLVDSERLPSLPGVMRPQPGAWDNFLSGTGTYTMKGFAEAARLPVMAAGALAVGAEKLRRPEPLKPIDTTLSDAVFKFHEDTIQSAVDYWTPKPGETGVAAQIAGTLLSTLPLVIASPHAAVAATQMSIAVELSRKGVEPLKANLVGAAQGLGLGLGIWAPILGTNGWQRMVVGGAGFNVAQGVATRGVSGTILAGTKAEEDFKAFDWEAMTLDALLGVAFGGIAHLSPAQRAQGENAWKRIGDWTRGLKPSDVDALAALRLGEHLNVETAPGKLSGLEDIDANTARARTALDQLAQDKPVQVEDQPAPKFEPDAARQADAERTFADLQKEAARVAKAEGIDLRDTPVAPRAETPNILPEVAGADPLQAEASRFATENPDVPLTVGKNADGTPITKTARQFMEDAEGELKQANADAKLFEVAAACMLGAA